MTSRSIPPASDIFAEMPVPAPPPTIGFPASTLARSFSRIVWRANMVGQKFQGLAAPRSHALRGDARPDAPRRRANAHNTPADTKTRTSGLSNSGRKAPDSWRGTIRLVCDGDSVRRLPQCVETFV